MFALKRNYLTYKVIDFFRFIYCTLMTLLVNGCSTQFSSEAYNNPWVAKYEPEAHYPPPKTRRYDIEEDGLPAQLPPSTRIRTLPDDPSQPWSVNYGKDLINNSSDRNIGEAAHVPVELDIDISQRQAF